MKKYAITVLILVFGLLLAACKPGTSAEPTATPMDPQAVFTSAASTAQARMTLMAATSPTALPTATSTPTPTQPVTTTLVLTATQPVPPAQAGIDHVTFVADMTVPDGTPYKPGEVFVKTWRLLNDGTTTWSTAYSLVFISGNQMNGSPSIPLSTSVAPGATTDISVSLTAPSQVGTQTGNWMLRNTAGKNFGLGPLADTPFYVQINVTGEAGAGTPVSTTGTPGATTGTPGATPSLTPTAPASGSVVKDAAISVDTATVEGACPYAFNFTAEFTLNQAATVTYQLEAETGFAIQLPAATTTALGAGKQTINYRLEFTNSFTGWARLHVTAPENVLSNQVNLKLTCQ